MSIGHHPEQPQHAPDMRKKQEDVTAEERQEAKRKIEGSLSPPPEDSHDHISDIAHIGQGLGAL